MARRGKLFLGSSLLHSLMTPCELERFCLQHAAKNANTNHQTYDRKTSETDPKMIQKPLQSRSCRGSGGLLGAIFETRCFQDLIFNDFGSIFGPPLGQFLGHFGYRFFDVFLRWLFDGFGLRLASQNTSKMRSKRVPKTHLIKK